MRAVIHCRTAALGGHVDICPRCGGDQAISYNSCRNRHCPKCQTQARQRWIDARKQELLETRYFHVVFTLPHELHSLIRQNETGLYNLLFRTVADTLLELRRTPSIWERRLASSASCVHGDKTCCSILTFTVSSPVAGSRRITRIGFTRAIRSFYR